MSDRRAAWILALGLAGAAQADPQAADNPLIDAQRYLADTAAAMQLRESRLLDEAGFLALASEPGTVILDARSAWAYQRLHIEGAVNLAYTDFNADSLAQRIPGFATRILIDCNNNFLGAPGAFPTKLPPTSLNLATLSALHSYGYRNVYQLAPVLDVASTRLPLVGRDAPASAQAKAETADER